MESAFNETKKLFGTAVFSRHFTKSSRARDNPRRTAFCCDFARFFLTWVATLLEQPFLWSDLLKLRIIGLRVRKVLGLEGCETAKELPPRRAPADPGKFPPEAA